MSTERLVAGRGHGLSEGEDIGPRLKDLANTLRTVPLPAEVAGGCTCGRPA